MLHSGKGRGFGHTNRGGANIGALSAPTLTRTSGVTTYPPTIDFTRPVDWQNGDTALMQRSQDVTFATGVTEVTQTLAGGTTSYNFGLSSVVSGVWYFRMAAWHGSRPAAPNWSNTVGVGTATAPAMTSSAALAGYQYIAGSFALTASLPSTFAITGGVDQAQATISGSNLLVDAQSVASALDIRITPTSVFQVTGTEQILTITNATNTASAFSFPGVTNATLLATYTSNPTTVAGISFGSVPITISNGTYSKNGSPYTNLSGTAVNGDVITLRGTAPARNSSTNIAVLSIGSTSGSYSIASPVVLSLTSAWNTSDTSAHMTISGTGNLTATDDSSGYAYKGVRATNASTNDDRYFEVLVNSVYASPGQVGIGIANASASLTTYTTDGNWIALYDDGTVNYVSSGWAGLSNFVAGTIIGVRLVFNAGKTLLYYYKNGQLLNPSGFDITAMGASLKPFFSSFNGGGCTLNTGHSTFSYQPSGSVAWDF